MIKSFRCPSTSPLKVLTVQKVSHKNKVHKLKGFTMFSFNPTIVNICQTKILGSAEMVSSSSSSSMTTTALTLLVLLLSLCYLSDKLLAGSDASNSTTPNHLHHFMNQRLHQAYFALQAWKHVIYYDPKNFTSNWVGPFVCDYTGVYCVNSPSDPSIQVVAGIDLNHAGITGFLPDDLGLLSDLALLHLNSNQFYGFLPSSLANLTLLFELDLSNNRFEGRFPSVVLSLPSLKFLDLRFNEFEGPLPPELFNRDLDAVFVNNNRFTSVLPSNLGGSKASVVVFANNNLGGCLSPSISKLANSLEELLLINTNLSGCLPPEIGLLYKLRVLDMSFNQFVGPIPHSVADLFQLEQLNLAHNNFSGTVPADICALPKLANFTFSYNFFCEEEGLCWNLTSKGIASDDRQNCLPEKPFQRTKEECDAVLEHPVECLDYHCGIGGSGQSPSPAPSGHY